MASIRAKRRPDLIGFDSVTTTCPSLPISNTLKLVPLSLNFLCNSPSGSLSESTIKSRSRNPFCILLCLCDLRPITGIRRIGSKDDQKTIFVSIRRQIHAARKGLAKENRDNNRKDKPSQRMMKTHSTRRTHSIAHLFVQTVGTVLFH